jgi:flagellar hook-length control protein FliK
LESASPPSVEAFRELAGSVTSTIPTVATPLPPAVEVATAPAGMSQPAVETLMATSLGATAQPPAPGLSPSAPPPNLYLQTPVGADGWDEMLGHQVAVHLAQGGRSAQLQVNPAELGPIEMHVSLERDRTVVTFIAQDAAVREAIQESLPRLRDALGAQGLQLTDARVAAEGGSGQHPRGAGGQQQFWERTGPRDEELEPQPQARPNLDRDGGQGLIDAYA